MAFLVHPGPAFSDLYDCGGIWTNKPCEGTEAQKTLPEIERPVDLDAEALKKKESLAGRLRADADRARRDHGIDLDISGVESACRAKETTYEDCMNLVNNADDRLSSRVNEAKLVKEQEKTNQLLEENAARENGGGRNNTVVVVEDDYRDIDGGHVYGRDWHKRRRHRHVDEGRKHEGNRPHEVRPQPSPPPAERPGRGKLGEGLQRDPLGRR